MAENTIDNLSIQVTASAERAVRTFDRLTSSAGRLRGAASATGSGMRDLAFGARDAGNATQEAGTQAGHASRQIGRFWNSLRQVGSQIRGGFARAVHSGISAIGTFVRSLARIAFYRAIRSIIKDLGQSFKDLYGYSRMFGTDFARSMDRITTASVYLRNSFAAMVAPLVNLFAPALDMLADKIVDILNFVNQLFAAINGQETYTVAKKVATSWESTFDSAANHANRRIKEVRNTLLGFDEINRLNGATPSTSGGSGSSPYTPGYSTIFEEKPLEGFFEKISNVTSGWPDWLKWLLGIGTVAIGAWGISKLPGLIGKIFDAFKNLFSITIPDWLRWLFGPKGDNDIGLDIPDHIDLPDADVPVNLKQGDWSVLQEIPSEKYLLLKVGVKMDGWLGNGNPQLPSNQPLVIDDDGSGTWDFTFQQAAMGANNLQAINNQLENMVDNWDDLAWEVAKMASGKVIDRTLRVAVKRSDSWDKTAWDAATMTDFNIFRNIVVAVAKKKGAWDKTAWLAANMTKYNVTRTVNVEVKQGDEWDKTAWLAANMTKYNVDRTVTVSVIKNTKNWDATAWLGANMTRNNADRTVSVSVNKKKGEWDATAWLGANMTRFDIPRNIIVSVNKNKGSWDETAWLGANMTRFDILRNIIVSVSKKSGGWDSTAWLGANMSKYDIPRDIIVSVSKKNGAWDATAWLGANMTKFDIPRNIIVSVNKKKGEWDNTAWLGANMTKFDIPRNIIVSVSKKIGEWNADAWKAANMASNSVTITVTVKLVQDGWTTVEQYFNDNFGGASGGGGQTSGGGAGRNVSVGIKLTENKSDQKSSSLWDMWWGVFNKTLSIEQKILMKLTQGWTGTPQETLNLENLTSNVSVGAIGSWAATVGGLIAYLGISDPRTTITADAASSWQWLGGTFKDVVGAGDTTSTITAQNAKNWSNTYKEAVGAEDTTTTITADISKAWEGQTALQYMKLTGLSTTVSVAIKPKSGSSKLTLTTDAHDANTWTLSRTMLGGIFNHGRRTNIPQYAGGTLNAHGSLFLAGEAGPEIVGHVGGRTEVLNKSQLASAMFSAVRAALAPAAANFAYAAQAMGTTSSSEPNYAGLYEIIRDAMGNALANDNGNRERNQLLREINDKDMNVEVSTSSINKAQTRMNRRAGTTIVAVGT